MQPQRTPTIIYAACSAALGVIALIAAIAWRLSIGRSSATAVAPASTIIAGILGFVGFLLLLWSVLYFIVLFVRRQSGQEEDEIIPSDVLGKTSDPTLQRPHDASVLNVPLDTPAGSVQVPQKKLPPQKREQ